MSGWGRRARLLCASCGVAAGVAAGMPAGASALSPGDLVVADFGTAGVRAVDPLTGVRATVSDNTTPPSQPAFATPDGVAIEAGGSLLVTDSNAFGGGGAVFRVDPLTGVRTVLSQNAAPAGGPSFVDPTGIAVEQDGDILVADRNAFTANTGGIIRVDPLTGVRTTVSENTAPAGGPSFLEPQGVAVAADGDILVAETDGFGATGGIISVDPLTGVRTTLSSNAAPAGGAGFSDPFGLTLEADGDILVVDASAFTGGGVIRVDPTSGVRTLLSSNSAPAGGPSFAAPTGLAVEADGDIVVSDFQAFGGTGGIIRVDPLSGVRTTVSENASPAGAPLFADPFAIAVVPAAPPPAGDYASTVLGDDPAGYWRFGEAPASTTLTDSSPNGNDGTYLNGVTLGVPGALAADPDTAASYDGVNDAGRVPDASSLDVGSSFTLEGWIKRSSTSKSHQMMVKGGGFQLVVMNAGSGSQVWLRKANVTTLARSSWGIPADGEYHHVVATMNGPGAPPRSTSTARRTPSSSALRSRSPTRPSR